MYERNSSRRSRRQTSRIDAQTEPAKGGDGKKTISVSLMVMVLVLTAGTAKSTSLELDASSSWTVTADSHLTSLTDAAGISGTAVKNTTSNGYTVTYDRSACSELGGKTYTLSGGGVLKPAGWISRPIRSRIWSGQYVQARRHFLRCMCALFFYTEAGRTPDRTGGTHENADRVLQP